MPVALLGVSFLTPLDGLFVLAAALPLGALRPSSRCPLSWLSLPLNRSSCARSS